MHTLNPRSKVGYLADVYFQHEEEIEQENGMYGFKSNIVPVDNNAGCIWEKEGNGLEAVDLGDVQLNIRERFSMESPADFTREGEPHNGNTVKGESYEGDKE